MSSDNKPVEKVRVGTVQFGIFRNEGEKGPYYKAALETAYKDGDTWKATSSYGRRELINLAKAALLADSKIAELMRRDKGESAEELDEAA